MKSWFRNNKSLVMVLAAALVMRLSLLMVSANAPLLYDEVRYNKWAKLFLETPGDFLKVSVPPFYSIFIAVVSGMFGGELLYVRLVQIAMSVFTVFVLYRIGEEALDRRAGIAVGLIAAFYPTLIFFSNHFWSETVFITFVYLSLYLLIRFEKTGSLKWLPLVGLSWGFASITRGPALFGMFFILLWICVRYRRELRRVPVYLAAVIIGMVIVMGPLKLTKSSPTTGFNGAVILFYANNDIIGYDRYQLTPEKKKKARKIYYALGETSKEREKKAIGLALDYIWKEQPLWVFKKLYYNMPRFFAFGTFEFRHLEKGLYGDAPMWFLKTALGVSCAIYALLLITSTAGIFYSRKNFAIYVVLGLMLYYIAIHIPPFTQTRYKVPIMPAMIIFSGLFVANIRGALERMKERPLGWRNVLFGLSISGVILFIISDIHRIFDVYFS